MSEHQVRIINPEEGSGPLQEVTSQKKTYSLSSGRSVTFQEPDGMASYKIAKIMGNDSLNPALNIFYRVAFCISEIDGTPVRPPNTLLDVEAVIARLATTKDWDRAVLKFQEWATEESEDIVKK